MKRLAYCNANEVAFSFAKDFRIAGLLRGSGGAGMTFKANRKQHTFRAGIVSAIVALAIPASADQTIPGFSESAPAPPAPQFSISAPLAPAAEAFRTTDRFGFAPAETIAVPLHISQDSLLGGLSSRGESPAAGIGVYYFSPGALKDLAGNVMPTRSPSTFGFSNGLSLFAPHSSSTGGVNLAGQFFLSSGSKPVPVSQNAPQEQAFSQTASYAGHDFNASFSLLNVGKLFSGDDALKNAIGSSDQTTLDAVNKLLAKKGQDDFNVALGFGNIHSALVNFKLDDLTDSLGGKKARTDQFNLDKALSRGMSFTAQVASITNAPTGGPSVTTTTSNFRLASIPAAKAATLDLTGLISSDNQGGNDQQVGLAVKRALGDTTVGLGYTAEDKKSDGATSAAVLRTVEYSASKNVAGLATVSADWKSTSNSQLTGGQHVLQDGTISVSATPIRRLTIQHQVTSKNHVSGQSVKAMYLMPRLLGMMAAKMNLSFDTKGGAATPKTNSRKLALDADLPRAADFLKLMSGATLHLENDGLQQADGNGCPAKNGGSYTVGLTSCPAEFKTFKWDWMLTTPYRSDGPQGPDSRALDLAVPVGAVTVAYSDKDQLPQSDGTFKDSKEQDIKLLTSLPDGHLSLTTEYIQGIDFLTETTHRSSLGLTLTGATGSNQKLDLGFAVQSNSVDGISSDVATTYRFGYHLNRDDENQLTLDSTVTTHTDDTGPTPPNPIDSTVQMSYKHAF